MKEWEWEGLGQERGTGARKVPDGDIVCITVLGRRGGRNWRSEKGIRGLVGISSLKQ